MNSRETGGTGSAAFDFQLRPVGRYLSLGLRISLFTVQGLCFSITSMGRVKSKLSVPKIVAPQREF